MKKHLPTMIAAIFCILLVICIFQISELKQEIQSLENNLENRLSYIERNVSSLSSNIDDKLEEQANLLADSQWTYGDADIKAGTVMLQCSVSPKEYRPEETEAVLTCNDTEYSMVLENGQYTAYVPVSLYEESYVSSVRFSEDGTIRTEKLDWYIIPRNEYLPMVFADYAGGSSGRARDGVFVKEYDGEIVVTVDQKADAPEIQSVTMVECMDDKVILKTDIPVESWENPFHYHLSKTVEIPFGSFYRIYIEVVDGHNLHHRAWVERANVSVDGQLVDDGMEFWRGVEASIHDAEGKTVYAPGGEWYRFDYPEV